MVTLSEENYLKAIYHLGKQGRVAVSTNAIAEKIDSKASSVTDMIKKLAEKNLANYIKYQGVTLTESGRLAAALVIRKHRLWEVFLVEKLNFSWDEVHDVAEQLEHIKSLKLVNELDALLGFPTHDPHGDPIPDKDGNYAPIKSVNILEVKPGNEGVLAQVKDSSDVFLRYLNKNNLALGDTIKVIDFEPFDNSLTIETASQKMIISSEVAKNLYISL
ncbi:metal-dependent transcriptional regulator [Tamlana sp. 2_MG-2023]|uniref:metal-dependent transcriptional regulator n=1 Tax=unclassified Tamlana TaxID=2614803 RepID=UPI0026E2DF92|nr:MULTISPECIES: metal-dependent transcriptional regulator [unclassified Tamlana]MDO6759859.1 metal-dependent transcriptional regulator [Tamlana sp. 2_MG-2023]MDO6791971.1 metal-dependent transcriptional regulator [Tamlana sp. 1_MG-2023]